MSRRHYRPLSPGCPGRRPESCLHPFLRERGAAAWSPADMSCGSSPPPRVVSQRGGRPLGGERFREESLTFARSRSGPEGLVLSRPPPESQRSGSMGSASDPCSSPRRYLSCGVRCALTDRSRLPQPCQRSFQWAAVSGYVAASLTPVRAASSGETSDHRPAPYSAMCCLSFSLICVCRRNCSLWGSETERSAMPNQRAQCPSFRLRAALTAIGRQVISS
jgi:hypothetical protein